MADTTNTIKLSDIITTLVINGFHISKVFRYENANIVNLYKFDKLGAEIKYSILFTNETNETPLVESLLKYSNSFNSKPIIVCDNKITDKCQTFSNEDFFNFFGEIVNTGLILIPNLSEVLNKLGFNFLPEGLVGKPDDLLEIYCKECLQFILESPTRRFGQDRIFERLPDGVVLMIGKHFMILFDAKAYKDGFSFSSDDINRFANYVQDFNKRYYFPFGNVLSFTVISGDFSDSYESLQKRSDELYRQCNSKLSCVKAEELGKIVQLLQKHPITRRSIAWDNIFSKLIIDVSLVEKEIKRVEKDNII
jgi:hypothetical protein